MRDVFSLDPQWRFCREEQVKNATRNDMFFMFSDDTKTGAAEGPRSDGYYDGDWDTVDLPHDWCTGAEFDEKGGQGKKPRSGAWYRRCFRAEPEWEGRRVFLRFDGIAIHSRVWLNGILIAVSESGYTPISTEITALLRYGDGNVLSVYTTSKIQEGWWYEGGGIYRDVWLTVTEDVRLREDGVFLCSEKGKDGEWHLHVRAEIDGDPCGCDVRVSCLGGTVSAPAQAVTGLSLAVKDPPLWGPETPDLVPVTAELWRDGEKIDTETIPFGFRTVRFDPETGCYVNEKPVKLFGCCLHHDHAGVGVAMTYPIQRFRLEKLRQMGMNAVRTSHNPQSPDFYRACDELGILVMDETRHFSATDEVLRQLRTMVRRDRNHPCVILWSLYNEEPLQCSPVGEKICRAMKAVIDGEDGTRLLTGGMNGALEPEGVGRVVDVMGFNYLQYGYDEYHALFPEKPILGSENESWRTSRCETENDRLRGVYSSFGRVRLVNLNPWASTPGDTWREILKRPFVSGGFIWTGMDYRGEASWPAVVSDSGALDLCGFEKDSYWWHRALWTEEPVLKLSPKWEGIPGNIVPVAVYTNCDTVELALNGTPLQRLAITPCDAPVLELPFQPGELSAAGYRGGKLVARDILCTAGPAAELSITCQKPALDGPEDLLIVNAALRDAAGTVLNGASDLVTFTVEGGRVLGVGNGDQASRESDIVPFRRLYHGLCQAVVVPDGGRELTVTAVCGGFSSSVKIPVGTYRRYPTLAVSACRMVIAPWRMSDVKPDYPSPEAIPDQRENWIPTTVGGGKSLMLSGKRGYASVTGQITVPEGGSGTLTVVLERVVGAFDLYLDRDLVFSAPERADRGFRIPLKDVKPGTGATLAIVFRLDGGDCGFYGGAYLTMDGEG